jgi:hypothetical protein
MFESLKIIRVCVAAAIVCGIIHDQFTARICVEYFTVFHPPIIGTKSPTLLAFGWGIIPTWWMGAFLGVLLAVAPSSAGFRSDGTGLLRSHRREAAGFIDIYCVRSQGWNELTKRSAFRSRHSPRRLRQ